jgi:hypothetical protein
MKNAPPFNLIEKAGLYFCEQAELVSQIVFGQEALHRPSQRYGNTAAVRQVKGDASVVLCSLSDLTLCNFLIA